MNILPRDKQIEIIAALTEGMSIRSVERLTGVHRDTIMRLGARVGRGCAELHDRMMVGLRVPRIECDELWQYVGCNQERVTKANIAVRGVNQGDHRLSHRQARQREYGPVYPRSARARAWHARDFDGRLSPLPPGDPRCLRRARGARRYRQDLFRDRSGTLPTAIRLPP
jgi:hypothetical protein